MKFDWQKNHVKRQMLSYMQLTSHDSIGNKGLDLVNKILNVMHASERYKVTSSYHDRTSYAHLLMTNRHVAVDN